jgi:hypothetical protein
MQIQTALEAASSAISPDYTQSITTLFESAGLNLLSGTEGKLAKLQFVLDNADTFAGIMIPDSINTVTAFYDSDLYDSKKFMYTKYQLIEALRLVKAIKGKLYDKIDDVKKSIVDTTIVNLEAKIKIMPDEVTQDLRQARAN